MTIRTLGTLLVKLLGLTWLIGGIVSLANMLAMLVQVPGGVEVGMDRYLRMSGGLSAVLLIAGGTVLLLGAGRIMSMIYPDADAEGPIVPDRYSLAELQSIVFGGVGAFLAITALRQVAELVYAIARQPAWDTTGQLAYALQGRKEELVGAAVQLVFAVVLLFSRSALAAGWSRLRPMKSDD